MSIRGTVRRFANERLTVNRYSGFYDSGRYEKTLEETFTISANVQPAGPTDLQRLPENYRKQGAFWIWPKAGQTLRTGSAPASGNSPGVVADEVEIDGVPYEVGGVDRWRRHTRYLVARAKQ